MLEKIRKHTEQLITERFIPKLQKVEGLKYLPYDDNYGNYGIGISGEASGVIRFQDGGCKLNSKRYKTLGEIDLGKWLKQKNAGVKSQAFQITREYWDKQKKAYDEILKFLKEAAEIREDLARTSLSDIIYQIKNADIKIYLNKFPTEEIAMGFGVGPRSPMRCVSVSWQRTSGKHWKTWGGLDKIIPTSFKKQLKKVLKETKN